MRLLLLCAVMLALVLTCAAPALAAGLAPPVPGRVLLAFGVPYDGKVHHGLDLTAEAGEAVRAPAAGTVTFAGRLPSDGGEALGVTVTTPDGLKVTCLPLRDLAVTRGQAVASGASLGALAGEGDASSASPHVHLSVRQGDSYLDPAKLLPATVSPPASASSPALSPDPAPAPQVPAVPVPGRPAARSFSGVPLSAPRTASSPAARPAGLALAAPAPAPEPLAASAPGAASVTVADAAPAAASALSACAAAVHTARAPVLRHVAPPQGSAIVQSIVHAFARLRSMTMGAAAAMLALAFLWPAWRRASAPLSREPEPLRVRA
jgi:hypothetical protein